MILDLVSKRKTKENQISRNKERKQDIIKQLKMRGHFKILLELETGSENLIRASKQKKTSNSHERRE